MASARFRPSTMDEGIWNTVMSGVEYGPCGPFCASDAVIDIGCHIGAFAAYVLARGAGFVAAYDADADNVALAHENLRAWGAAVELHVAAVGRSDQPLGRARISAYPMTSDGLVNTGGGKICWDALDGTVPSLAFDRVVDDALSMGRRSIRLLKLDCEGSEWPILFTSRRLDAIDEIVGEYHELARDDDDSGRRYTARQWDCSGPALGAFLRRAGFDVDVSVANAARLGHFCARRIGRRVAA
jgi:FkbM family methyltransferase